MFFPAPFLRALPFPSRVLARHPRNMPWNQCFPEPFASPSRLITRILRIFLPLVTHSPQPNLTECRQHIGDVPSCFSPFRFPILAASTLF